MNRPSIAAAVLVATAGLALGACGSSSSSATTSAVAGGVPASSSSSSSDSSSTSISIPNGSSFCTQVALAVSQFTKLGAGFSSGSGATPNVATFQQLMAAEASTLDSLDGSAPSEIAASFHTLRLAIDQANTNVQGATTLQQVGTAFAPVSTPQVQAASSSVSSYLKTSCGISASTTTST